MGALAGQNLAAWIVVPVAAVGALAGPNLAAWSEDDGILAVPVAAASAVDALDPNQS